MLHPSLTMWCMVEQQHVLLVARGAAASARSSGPRSRSKGRSASSRARRRASCSRPAGASPVRSSTGRCAGAAGWTTCTAPCSTGRNVVRSASWRRTSSPSARSSAARVEAPPQPARPGHVVAGALRLHLVQEPEPLLREGERQRRAVRPAGTSGGEGGALARAAHLLHAPGQLRHRGSLEERPQRHLHAQHLPRRARPPAWPAASARPARRSSSVHPHPLQAAAPRAQIPASTSSTGVRGATYRSASAAYSGAGSALRSSFPFGVSGSASSATNAAGHHVLRQALGAGARAARPPPRRPPRTPPAAARPAVLARHAPRTRARPRAPAARASISPSSMRKPRTFTC